MDLLHTSTDWTESSENGFSKRTKKTVWFYYWVERGPNPGSSDARDGQSGEMRLVMAMAQVIAQCLEW